MRSSPSSEWPSLTNSNPKHLSQREIIKLKALNLTLHEHVIVSKSLKIIQNM